MGRLFDSLMVANRGEIACRIMRTAKRLGIKTIAVYSEADARAPHVRLADQAVCIGKAASSESYLKVDTIIEAMRATGAQAVHPGYGFLSENAAFSEAVEAEGKAFVGPGPFAIRAMGDKIESKKLAAEAGVDTIPGFLGVLSGEDEAAKVAAEVGFPVMIKASAGGGGKGMRVAWNEEEARQGFTLSSREAASSFGDDRIFIERYVENPRHIEIQLIADAHGNAVYLPERDCSIQRRNQKVVEEAPAPGLSARAVKAMGEQAVALAKAVGYRSAGTVEFLIDSREQHYFLEMNTRLQVEHPVTESVAGVDLVEEMIRVAAGEKLRLTQEQVQRKGWAMECRVYAEDPLRGFLPCVGTLSRYQHPDEAAVVRASALAAETRSGAGESAHAPAHPHARTLARTLPHTRLSPSRHPAPHATHTQPAPPRPHTHALGPFAAQEDHHGPSMGSGVVSTSFGQFGVRPGGASVSDVEPGNWVEVDASTMAGTVRVDDGVEEGGEISIHYDPMVSKLITHGRDRDHARELMSAALDRYHVAGVRHNLNFLRTLMNNDRFAAGNVATSFIPDEFPTGYLGHEMSSAERLDLIAAAAALQFSAERSLLPAAALANGLPLSVKLDAEGEAEHNLVVAPLGAPGALPAVGEPFALSVEGGGDGDGAAAWSRALTVRSSGLGASSLFEADVASEAVGGAARPLAVQVHGKKQLGWSVVAYGMKYDVLARSPRAAALTSFMRAPASSALTNSLLSPMPGTLLAVAVAAGDKVAIGQSLCTVEAMKMQNVLVAERDGVVKEVLAQPGAVLATDQPILSFVDAKAAAAEAK